MSSRYVWRSKERMKTSFAPVCMGVQRPLVRPKMWNMGRGTVWVGGWGGEGERGGEVGVRDRGERVCCMWGVRECVGKCKGVIVRV